MAARAEKAAASDQTFVPRKPEGKAPPGSSTLGHYFGSQGEFERSLHANSDRMGFLKGRLYELENQLQHLNINNVEQQSEALTQVEWALMKEIDGFGKEVDELKDFVESSIKIEAPLDKQKRFLEARAEIDRRIKSFYEGPDSLNNHLVRDTTLHAVNALDKAQYWQNKHEEQVAENAKQAAEIAELRKLLEARDDEIKQLKSENAAPRENNAASSSSPSKIVTPPDMVLPSPVSSQFTSQPTSPAIIQVAPPQIITPAANQATLPPSAPISWKCKVNGELKTTKHLPDEIKDMVEGALLLPKDFGKLKEPGACLESRRRRTACVPHPDGEAACASCVRNRRVCVKKEEGIAVLFPLCRTDRGDADETEEAFWVMPAGVTAISLSTEYPSGYSFKKGA